MVPTQEHWRIQRWARERNARPAQIRRLTYDGQPAILTFVFDDVRDTEPEITPISWEMFFAQFDVQDLSMAWDEGTPLFDIVKVEKNTSHASEH